MEFPFGHHAHTRHHKREEGSDYPPPSFGDGSPLYPPPSSEPPPPPPPFGDGSPLYPPPSSEPPPPPPPFGAGNLPPHPPQSYSYYGANSEAPLGGGGGGGTHVRHSSHHVGGGILDHHSMHPQPPPSHNFDFPEHHVHGGGYSPPQPQPQPQPADSYHYSPHLPSIHHHHRPHGSELDEKPTVRVFTKARTDYSLTIRDGKVLLAPSDPSDPFQHWIKDEKYSTRVKDEEGFPSFALVNKATAQAIKHSIGATHPVQLIPYNLTVLDESILWTQSKDLGDGYRAIRMVNNIRLNVDAFHGDKNHGGVHDGTTIVLWEWKKGDNQRWKIIPY
ncbi:ricin B-like lectin EULS3 [Diospyros lotus]|uniref:ricin B-like lectin EULS3 n=1 Tax=Diospyros lotus TaxID=55363 RepID=UPI0022526A0C|nr:ricin B-like lectin EULS3 [Diospyros lotus]